MHEQAMEIYFDGQILSSKHIEVECKNHLASSANANYLNRNRLGLQANHFVILFPIERNMIGSSFATGCGR